MLMFFMSACSMQSIKSEFYRGEIKYLHSEAVTSYKAGDYTTAKQLLENILGMQEDYLPAQIQLAHIALAEGRGAQALSYYKEVLAQSPDSIDELEPYLAYAMTMPASLKDGDGGVNSESVIGRGGSAKNHLTSTTSTVITTQIARRQGLEMLVEILETTDQSRIDQLHLFIQQIVEPEAWISNQRKVMNPEIQQVSAQLLQNYQENGFDNCTVCLTFAALWFGSLATQEQWPVLTEAIEQTRDGAIRDTLIYDLGLSYEQSGEHVLAINTYLKSPSDPRIMQRLQAR